MSKKDCKHGGGYLLQDGELRCAQCGAPSESKRWRANVFGAHSAEAKQQPAPSRDN